jgi:TctA family transporter
MSALSFPVSPLALGLILGGDLLDVQFRRALMAGKGFVAPFSTDGVTIALILFIAVIVFYQVIVPKLRGKKRKREPSYWNNEGIPIFGGRSRDGKNIEISKR